MVSLWGTKKDGGDRQDGGEDESQQQPPQQQQGGGGGGGSDHRSREADERTRLLPPPRSEGYLDPDDPAVTPNNLWTVRALRFFTSVFTAITFVWWTILLVSIFVSPPGMNTRGSGFFDFSYTTATLGILGIAVLFFTIPSRALQITTLIVAVLLLVDMIVILAVPNLRSEEGWVGITSVVWATVMALFNVLTDRVVAWGKKEEEVRLTGRRERRRSLREWCAVLTYSVFMVIIIIVIVLMTATLVLRSRDATLPFPGQRFPVDDGKYEVHLNCVGDVTNSTGAVNPTVLIEAGELPYEGTLDPFISSAYVNGTIPRYCFWDRPGMAFSDNAPSPHSAGMTADALSEALAEAGEEGPWILLSAGIGSIYSRIFSSRHMGEVAGIMLVDPLHEDLLWQVGAPGRGFFLWAYGVISPLGLSRLPGAMFKGRTREDRVYGISVAQSGKFIKAQLQENLVASSLTKSEVGQAKHIQAKTTPLVVVSSGIKCRSDDDWASKQEALTKITQRLIAWDVVKMAPHEVWQTRDGRDVLEKRLGELVGLAAAETAARSAANT